MTKKRLLLIASLPLTIAVILGILAMLPPSPGVTKANFDRIEKGMTRAEVEEIFGREGQRSFMRRPGLDGFRWDGEGKTIASIWLANDCVSEKEWHVSEWPNETFPEKICRWLHLP
jgi:hypothetical protein